MRKVVYCLMASILLSGFYPICETRADSSAPYKIGIDNALSGVFSVYAVDFQEGIEMAVEEINSKGGINGHPVKLIVRDDESDPVTVTNNIRSLAAAGAHVMIGMPEFGLACAAGPVIEEVKLPCIQMAPIDPPYVEPGGYNFGGIYTNMDGLAAARNRAAARHGLTRLGLLMTKDPVGEVTSEAQMRLADETGVKIVGLEWMLQTDKDVTPQLIKLRKAKPDMIVNGGTGQTAVIMFKSLKRLGWKIPMGGSDANASPAFIKAMGEDADIALVFAPATAMRPQSLPKTHPTRDRIIKIANMWEARTGRPLGSIGAWGYDLVQSLVVILDELNLDPADENLQDMRDKIRQALEHQSYQGLDVAVHRSPEDHKGAEEVKNWIARAEQGKYFVPVTDEYLNRLRGN